MNKKKILLLSDDLRMSSGIGTMSKEFVLGTIHHYDWVQIGGAIKHPENGKVVEMKDSVKTETGVEEIWGQEQILWSKNLRYAGRCDMVGLWKGKPSIIDFKTSKRVKNIKQIKDYFIQCCAYAVAHNELYGTGIREIVILITVDGKDPQCFETSAVPFLGDLKLRRRQYDLLP